MPSKQLENLVKSGQLKAEPPAQAEINGLIASGRVRLPSGKLMAEKVVFRTPDDFPDEFMRRRRLDGLSGAKRAIERKLDGDLGAFFYFFSLYAQASGCLDPDWQVIERRDLPDATILMNYYGEAKSSVNVIGQGAWVIFSNVGTEETKLNFYSGSFSLKKIDLADLLRALRSQYPQFMAHRSQVVSVNQRYDDCEGIPEGTRKTEILYSFSVKLPNGESQAFEVTETTFDPPLQRQRF